MMMFMPFCICQMPVKYKDLTVNQRIWFTTMDNNCTKYVIPIEDVSSSGGGV